MKRLALAFALLVTPAHAGKSDLEKMPACAAGAPVKVMEPDLAFVAVPIHQNYFFAIAQAKAWLKVQRMGKPCDMDGRVRSKVDGKCYLKSRLP